MKKQNKTLVDVAILTAGRVDLFEKCVDALLPQLTNDYRVYVCNNGHPSEEYERIYKKLPEGSIIKRPNQDGGFSYGANTVIKAGNSPLVFFITDDVFVQDGVIDKLVRVMDDQTIALSGYKLLFPEDSTDPTRPAGKVQHIGMTSNIRGDLIHPLIGWSADNPKCNISGEVLCVTGASFMVRRSAFIRAGGFDTAYGKGYYEDVDLCFKIRSQGGRIWVSTDAVATHGVGQTFKNEKNPAPIQQNQMLFRSRWLSQMPWLEFTMW